MAVRLLTTLADATAARVLYKAARDAGALDFWPGGSADLSVADVLAQVQAGDTLPFGYFQPANTMQGFFLVRRASIPALDYTPPMPTNLMQRQGWQLWLWITKMGLADAQMKTGLDAFFDGADGWLPKVHGLCWGVLPVFDAKGNALLSPRSKNYMDARPNSPHYDYTDSSGVVWRTWTREQP